MSDGGSGSSGVETVQGGTDDEDIQWSRPGGRDRGDRRSDAPIGVWEEGKLERFRWKHRFYLERFGHGFLEIRVRRGRRPRRHEGDDSLLPEDRDRPNTH